MGETKSKKLRQNKSPMVIMSKMDYMIARNVYERSFETGFDDEEISFLMGKRNKYFFDLIDPTQKNKFKTEQLDILPAILSTTIKNIVPNDVKPDEEVKLKAVKTVFTDKIVYQHVIINTDGSESTPIIWTKKLHKGERRKANPELHSSVIELVDEGHFSKPRSSLELYNSLKINPNLSFHPSDLQKCLSILLRNEGGIPKLIRQNNDARYHYIKNQGIDL